MTTYVVSHFDGHSDLWAWVEADSPEQIVAAFRDIVVHDPPPAWATPELMKEFGCYKIEGTIDGWLGKRRR